MKSSLTKWCKKVLPTKPVEVEPKPSNEVFLESQILLLESQVSLMASQLDTGRQELIRERGKLNRLMRKVERIQKEFPDLYRAYFCAENSVTQKARKSLSKRKS